MPLQNTSPILNPHLSKWDYRFIRIANEVQSWSKDPSTKCGCVLVKDRRILSTGYNGLPANLSDSLTRYQDREYKLATIIHAEKNAIFNAAKNGSTTEGSTAYVTWPPCSQCASALIQAGVTKVVCPDPATSPERWRGNFKIANEMLYEAGVFVLYFGESLPCPTETAPFAEQLGSQINFTGLAQEKPAATSTLTLSSVADLLPARLRDA
jgi:dCMP deaminase